jgi:PAS domain S-box-containing protein
MTSKPLILLAGSPHLSMETVASVLQSKGWDTFRAEDLHLESLLREQSPAMLVVALDDISLVSNIVRQTIAASPSLPVPLLILSATSDPVEAHASALEAGADNFLTFPPNPRELEGVAASLLRRAEYRTRVVQEAESRFSRIFENAAVGIAQLRPNGGWLRVNDRLCAIVGYSREELLRTTFQQITYPPDLQSDLDLLERLLLGEIPNYQMEKRYIHRAGHLVWINLTVGIERDEGGEPKYLVSVIEDINDRKSAERIREITEERLTAALRASATGTFRWDVKEDSLVWDASLKQIFGFPASHPINGIEDFTTCLHPDDRASVFAALEKCRAEGSDFDLEFRIVWPDGSVHWIVDRGRMFLDEDGNPEYMTGACLDVTVRKQQAEEQLANAERLRLALLSANAGSFDWDIANQHVQWSTELETLHGLEPGSFGHDLGNWTPLVHPEDREAASRIVAESLKTGGVNGQWRIVRPNGEVRWVNGVGKVFYGPNGEPVRMLGVNIDITQQKVAEQALRERAQIIDQIHDAILTADMNNCITMWNHGAERLFGYTTEEVQGHPVNLLHVPGESAALLAEIWGSLHVRGHFETEVRLRRKSGELFDAHLSIVVVLDEQARPTGTIGYVSDITERKRTEHALRVSEKLAATGRLASTLAHEINNPLASVTNLMYLLAHNPGLDETARGYVALAESELSRVSHITRNLLSFHREGRDPQLVDPAGILDDLLGLYRPKLRSRGIEILREYHPTLPIYVHPGELKQVISNLLENALDVLSDGGQLRIRLKNLSRGNGSRSGVVISIADNGRGIEPRHLAQLFEPFFTTKGEKGTGLGLWVSKDIIAKHNGRIAVRSRLDRGSVFSIFLPAARVAKASHSIQ